MRAVKGVDDMSVSDTHTEMAMGMERTFSIVKPDAVARNLIGEIYSRFEKGGLRIVASKMLHLNRISHIHNLLRFFLLFYANLSLVYATPEYHQSSDKL